MLDIVENRKAVKYSRLHMLMRLLWGLAVPLFSFSPRVCFSWRASLLRIFGAQIGKNVHIYNSATIYMPWNLEIGDYSSIGEYAFIYNLGKITIGAKTTISQRVHLCAGAHDYNDPILPLLKPPINVEDHAWVCADAFVGPGITVGEGAVVGARACVFKNVAPWTVVGGNPARFIKNRILK